MVVAPASVLALPVEQAAKRRSKGRRNVIFTF
jgi:hypothetical protein